MAADFPLHSYAPAMPRDVFIADSVTHFDASARGRVAIAASHGGVFAVHMALARGLAGLVLSDAGVGREGAGIAGLEYANALGVPCATVDYRTARIGDGVDCAVRGVISYANAAARSLGVRLGMGAMEAAQRMRDAQPRPVDPGAPPSESRSIIPTEPGERPIALLDSASLVQPADAGAVVLTGSHGGLLGGRSESAIKVDVFAALYNDAGIGCDEAGVSRLPVLDARGIAGATVSAMSVRIGDARSAWDSGVLSRVNQTARFLGAREGMSAQAFAWQMARAR